MRRNVLRRFVRSKFSSWFDRYSYFFLLSSFSPSDHVTGRTQMSLEFCSEFWILRNKSVLIVLWDAYVCFVDRRSVSADVDRLIVTDDCVTFESTFLLMLRHRRSFNYDNRVRAFVLKNAHAHGIMRNKFHDALINNEPKTPFLFFALNRAIMFSKHWRFKLYCVMNIIFVIRILNVVHLFAQEANSSKSLWRHHTDSSNYFKTVPNTQTECIEKRSETQLSRLKAIVTRSTQVGTNPNVLHANAIDRYSRITFPVVFFVFCCIYWLVYTNASPNINLDGFVIDWCHAYSC